MALAGVVMASASILSGQARVLYTFYPPLTATPWFYIGLVLVVAGSWIWCVLMLWAMAGWKKDNPGKPVPLAMYATVANAVMWLWTTVGVAVELRVPGDPGGVGLDADDRRRRLPARCSPGPCTRSSTSGCSRPTSPSTRWRRGRPGGRLYSDTDGPAQLRPFPALQPAGRHASPVHGPGALDRLQVPADDADGAGHRADAADGVHHLRLDGDRRTPARRQGPLRLDRRAALGSADGAGHRPRLLHAVVRRLRRPDQHELRHERHGPQHLVGDGALPSDLRRHGGDHVLRHSL